MSAANSPQRTASIAAIGLALATVYVVWGSTYLGIKFAVEHIPPLLMAGVRFLIAGLVLYVIVRPRAAAPPTAREWASTALIGSLLLIGGNGPVCWAETFVPSGVTALIVGTAPLWFAALDWLLFRGPRPTAPLVAALAAGLLGIYLISRGDTSGRISIAGVGALMAACFFWSLGSLLSRRLPMPKATMLGSAMQMICAGAALVLLAASQGQLDDVAWGELPPSALWSMVYLIVVGSLIGFSAYVWLLGVCPPAIVSTYAYVNPLVAVALGAWLGDEPITWRLLAGAAVIVGSVVVITTQSRRSRGVPQPAASPPARAQLDSGETA